ncbi:MAG: hypothetical protein E7491_07570 [Ruminococcaceae bacterium]|nr:hypothetical protein [Oscillospiraceae bacterium]
MKKFKKCCLPVAKTLCNMIMLSGVFAMAVLCFAGYGVIHGAEPSIPLAIAIIVVGLSLVPMTLWSVQKIFGNNACMDMTFIENGVQVKSTLTGQKRVMTWDEVVDCGVCYASMSPKIVSGLFFAKKEIPTEARKFSSVSKMQNTEDFFFIQYSESMFNEMLPYLPEHIKEKLAAEIEECKAKEIC